MLHIQQQQLNQTFTPRYQQEYYPDTQQPLQIAQWEPRQGLPAVPPPPPQRLFYKEQFFAP